MHVLPLAVLPLFTVIRMVFGIYMKFPMVNTNSGVPNTKALPYFLILFPLLYYYYYYYYINFVILRASYFFFLYTILKFKKSVYSPDRVWQKHISVK